MIFAFLTVSGYEQGKKCEKGCDISITSVDPLKLNHLKYIFFYSFKTLICVNLKKTHFIKIYISTVKI